MTRNLILAAASMLALSACTVGPRYVSPVPAAPSQAPFLEAGKSPAFSGEQPPGPWWSLFGDPLLDQLVGEALTANTDLRVAAANLAQARAVLRESRAGRLPTTTVGAGGTYARQANPLGAGSIEGDSYDVGLDIGYQVDLFGRVESAIRASRADADAVQAAFDLTRITVAAETTRAYTDVCSFNRQIAVAEDTLRIQQQTFDLTRRLFEGGRATRLETGQAGALLEQTRATIPTLTAQRAAALYRLAVLTGKPPAEAPAAVLACQAPPELNRPIPVGDGASLLARRPDIRRAERQLAAAAARVNVATADLYPSISLGGSVGSTASSISGLGKSDGFRFSLGPLISWSFPNMEVARSRLKQAEAGADGALASFDGTWLTALQESESALANYAGELDRLAALRRAAAEAGDAARIARLRYQAGRENFQVVLDAERTLASINASIAQSEQTRATNLVSLFLALGGGWQDGGA
ncbi:TolC family protein [Sphingopyxis sp. OPL5]|uniref:efflux transporter outer membrane subunit n=1 Tax=unclassified Sphingopyxis TaxID=2614943 RepID=UPI0006FCDE9F|nr:MULTISPECIES: TolC family protein [unclassified Sphingopyxis]KQZ65783.1 RND transporter [Sphingopyxis sp. Root1497]QNO29419.1 TolC family protein [Sphingopyxis sp. OPL5]